MKQLQFFLKQPVSLFLGKVTAIKMVLEFIMKKLQQKMEIKDVLILSDSQSSVGLLTLDIRLRQRIYSLLTELKQIHSKGV